MQIFIVIGVAAGGTVIGLMLYFIRKYRYSETHREPEYEHPSVRSRSREAIILAFISIIILFGVGVASYRLTDQIQYPPAGADILVINVTAFQWDFLFAYPGNVSTVGTCKIPGGEPIIFNVTSSDVYHNFGLPNFKLKIDAIPGMHNILWINAPTPSGNDQLNYTIHCYELCGEGHTYMTATLNVMNPTAFDQWYIQAKLGVNMTGG